MPEAKDLVGELAETSDAPFDPRLLSRFERFGLGLARLVNQRFKGAASLYQRWVLGPIFWLCVGRLLRIEGLRHPRALPQGAPFLLVANHRSFFDFFVLSTALYLYGGVARRLYFPVRANFFYQTAPGLLINAVVGGFSLYPPIFRERQKLAFNRFAIDEAARLLSTRAALVGIHPEGTRGKGSDPYTLLPAQPGVGRVALRARVPVVPAFVTGLENDLWGLVRRNWTGGAPVRVTFGPPVALDDLYAEGDRSPTHRRIAERLRDALVALGSEQRAGSAAASPTPP